MGVSMTWPQYRRRQCVLGGQGVRLTPRETDVVSTLLLSPPDRFTPVSALTDSLWPNPDDEPANLNAPNYLSVYVRKLRRRGMAIEGQRGWGWRIPAHARAI